MPEIIASTLYNPTRMGFGKLRVVNDDWVESGTGFPSHGMFKVENNTGSKTGNVTMNKGDGAEMTQSNSIIIRATTDCEIIIIDTIA